VNGICWWIAIETVVVGMGAACMGLLLPTLKNLMNLPGMDFVRGVDCLGLSIRDVDLPLM
jgi:hypothetical protein